MTLGLSGNSNIGCDQCLVALPAFTREEWETTDSCREVLLSKTLPSVCSSALTSTSL